MDVVRKKSKSRKWLRWIIVLALIGGGAVATTKALSSLEQALPEFERSEVITAEVDFGTMVRTVRGPGTLVPENSTWVTTEVGGSIVEIFVEPGDNVSRDTVLMKLRDPQMERSLREAKRAVDSARAAVKQYELSQKSQQLDLRVSTATSRSNFEDAREQAELNERLARQGLISRRTWEFSRDKAERNRMLLEAQIERAQNSKERMDIELTEKKAAVVQAEDWLDERKEQEKNLLVKAPVSGVVTQLGLSGAGLEAGQRVSLGSSVAKITDPTKLKAMLRISQTQAQEVVEGQPVEVDTRNGIVTGRVKRTDPAVQNERVTVEVELTGELPKGARPDLSVEGLIEVSRINETHFVRKPAFARENRAVEIFKVAPDGKTAVRTLVEFGKASSFTIEVAAGLTKGDTIVISQTSEWKDYAKVQFK